MRDDDDIDTTVYKVASRLSLVVHKYSGKVELWTTDDKLARFEVIRAVPARSPATTGGGQLRSHLGAVSGSSEAT